VRADEEQLHAADPGQLESEIMELALARTGAHHGAIFLWDADAGGLVIALHVVEGLTVTIPDRVLKKGSPGIALAVFESDQPYLCRDTSADPHYTRYLLDVGSIAAVPIRYQHRPIGVITVSSRRKETFTEQHLDTLTELADKAAVFVRRAQLDRQSRERTGRPFLIKGLSPGWLEVERRIEHAAPTNAPILIRGESGTGKDLVARAIHFNSRRADAPYVTVNCAAIPETMLESILFGHVKGAFTGASFTKLGEFKKADGGTLFLDEVGELPMMLQAKVLRAVEQGEVQPLGSNEPTERVDVRLICATNRDLAAMAREGKFRDDLYYRLGVMTIELPPLRSYKDNLEVLAHVFVQQSAERHDKTPPPRISRQAMARITAYDYPGNVRELKNAIEHAVIMCAGDTIEAADLPESFLVDQVAGEPATDTTDEPAVSTERTLREQREAWLAPLERRYLSDLLEECDGNVREAARRAGINPVTMYRLLKKRGLEIRREVARTR
jgi:DNA-binding NtrC family response regulator